MTSQYTHRILDEAGVDAVLDMARTSVNVVANCQASAVIARSEGEFSILSS